MNGYTCTELQNIEKQTRKKKKREKKKMIYGANQSLVEIQNKCRFAISREPQGTIVFRFVGRRGRCRNGRVDIIGHRVPLLS